MNNPETELSQESTIDSLSAIAESMSPDDGQDEQEEQEEVEASSEDEEGAGEEDSESEATEGDWKLKKGKVSVDGVEYEVTADEAFKGYMRQQDYTRGTTATAELTRKLHAQDQFVRQEYAQRINQLNSLAQVLHQELVGDQSSLAGLIESDPQEYLRRQALMGHRAQLLNQVQAQHQAINQMQINDSRQKGAESLKANEAKLLERLPEWRDEGRRVQAQREIVQSLLDVGYTTDELNELSDHRAVLVAHKAMLWDKAQALKGKQVARPPVKPVTPGSGYKPDKQAASAKKSLDNYRSNPNLTTLAAFAESRGI